MDRVTGRRDGGHLTADVSGVLISPPGKQQGNARAPRRPLIHYVLADRVSAHVCIQQRLSSLSLSFHHHSVWRTDDVSTFSRVPCSV